MPPSPEVGAVAAEAGIVSTLPISRRCGIELRQQFTIPLNLRFTRVAVE
jgi:hypothetical protein